MGMMIRRNMMRRAVVKTAPVVAEVQTENQYTKTSINRMSTADLKDLALSNGIEGAGDMTGADLKKALIKKLDL